ncbi:MAG: hypothetical protein IJB74_04240 [Clostridia bacterium]|nr:hypothetical protein [Clostridia bacterium]
MKNIFCRSRSLYDRIKEDVSVTEIVLWWLTRALLISCVFMNKEKAGFFLAVTVFTFSADILRAFFSGLKLSFRLQSFICALSLVSAVAGIGFGVLGKHPDFDLFIQFVGGLFSGALGYYITMAMRKPQSKNESLFVTFFTLCFSGTVTILRKLAEFFSDFLFGTNLCHVEFVEDSHWFYRLFGFAMSPYEQRPLLDTDEDFIFSIIGGVISAAVVYLKFRMKSKDFFVQKKKTFSSLFANPLKRFREKIALEIKKVTEDTSIFDRLFWWCVRFAMLYAFFEWDNRPEATLMLANLIGTFAITLVHLVFPRDSVLSNISYKVQSLITVIVFLGSYGGNYCEIYYIVPRFDLFLHFVSGVLCVMGGYYIALLLVEHKTRKDSLLISFFAFAFSCFIMPAWEVSEFIGDFIWGTSNQGFYWGPTEESFFFKVFGHGVGNTQLYYLFDTVYDVLLAMVTTVITFVALYIWLEYRRKKNVVIITKKEKITC